jgi:hypothetical protein
MKALRAELENLPQPAPPPCLDTAVMVRIADLEGRRAAGADERRRAAAAATHRHRRAWAVSLSGAAAAVGALAYMAVEGAVGLPIASRLTTFPGAPLAMPAASPAVLVMATGLVLYVAGLVAPARHSPLRRPPG